MAIFLQRTVWQLALENTPMHECPKCQSDRVIKNGSAAGKPKKQWKVFQSC